MKTYDVDLRGVDARFRLTLREEGVWAVMLTWNKEYTVCKFAQEDRGPVAFRERVYSSVFALIEDHDHLRRLPVEQRNPCSFSLADKITSALIA